MLMPALKSSGGITLGRGITDSPLDLWIHALPLCIPLCNALDILDRHPHRKISSVLASSEQHVEEQESSQKKDSKNVQRFLAWIDQHSPFRTLKTNIIILRDCGRQNT